VPAPELSNHPGVADSVEIRALRKAVELAGGRKALAARLGLKVRELERWFSGKAAVPRETLLRIVDVLLDELASPAEGDDGDPPAPRFSAPSARRDCD
jgi:transcriptional regulator with XRE-family HTH domain